MVWWVGSGSARPWRRRGWPSWSPSPTAASSTGMPPLTDSLKYDGYQGQGGGKVWGYVCGGCSVLGVGASRPHPQLCPSRGHLSLACPLPLPPPHQLQLHPNPIPASSPSQHSDPSVPPPQSHRPLSSPQNRAHIPLLMSEAKRRECFAWSIIDLLSVGLQNHELQLVRQAGRGRIIEQVGFGRVGRSPPF